MSSVQKYIGKRILVFVIFFLLYLDQLSHDVLDLFKKIK